MSKYNNKYFYSFHIFFKIILLTIDLQKSFVTVKRKYRFICDNTPNQHL